MFIEWKFNNKEVSDLQDMPNINGAKPIGFAYKISFIGIDNNVYSYYGKKSLIFKKRKKALNGFKRDRISLVESDWLQYYGSSYNVQNLLKTGKIRIIYKQIIKYCYSKTELNYEQTKILFSAGTLQDKFSFNENILGKFFSKVEKQWKKIV